MPYTRSGKCVYKKNADGSRGEKKGCSDSEEEAKQYMKRLYSLDETDAELLDEDETLEELRHLVRELLLNEEAADEPSLESAFTPGWGSQRVNERLLREWVQQILLTEASFSTRFTALGIPGHTTSKEGAKPTEDGYNPNQIKGTAMRFIPDESVAGDPEGSLTNAGLQNVKNLGTHAHASRWETWSFNFPGKKETSMIIWMGNDNTKNPEPDKIPIPQDMLGVFAEHATVQGLGGTDTLAAATGGMMAAQYNTLTPDQKALSDKIYNCCVELAGGAFRSFGRPAGTAVNGNEHDPGSELDVLIMLDKGITTADVHIKFNDSDRMFGIQADDEVTGKKWVVTSAAMKDPKTQPGMPGFFAAPAAAQYKLARNAFLNEPFSTGTTTTTPYEVITGEECPAGSCPINRLAKMKEPDIDPATKEPRRTKKGKLKPDKSMELRMFDSDLKIGNKTMRAAYIEYLARWGIPDLFLSDITKFFQEGAPPVYFFNYRTRPVTITTGKQPIAVYLDVTLLKGDVTKFSIESIDDDSRTELYTVLYDGAPVFNIETRTRGSQNHPPQVKVAGRGTAGTSLKTKKTIGPCLTESRLRIGTI